jgi:hypothetical protein
MGGVCSVCWAAYEQTKRGAWEDASSFQSVAVDSVMDGVPSTIHVPGRKTGIEHSKQHLLEGNGSDDEQSDSDDDADDERDDWQDDGLDDSIPDVSSTSSCDGGGAGGGYFDFDHHLQNVSLDLFMSDTDCDDADEDANAGEDEDEDANLLGESLYTTERDDSDGADEELLLTDSSPGERSLLLMSAIIKSQGADFLIRKQQLHEQEEYQQSSNMLQMIPENEPNLLLPTFVEQFGCMVPPTSTETHHAVLPVGTV